MTAFTLFQLTALQLHSEVEINITQADWKSPNCGYTIRAPGYKYKATRHQDPPEKCVWLWKPLGDSWKVIKLHTLYQCHWLWGLLCYHRWRNIMGSSACVHILGYAVHTNEGGSDTNKSAQELTRSRTDRKTVIHPAPPGDRIYAYYYQYLVQILLLYYY